MINLTINGQKIEVEKGITLLEAAQKLGIKIPTLCYHKALPSYGACRLCLVEISQNGGSSSIQASCTYPAQDGLIVKTDTERVIRTRKIMAELLLARCPDSEEVKRIAKELGVGRPRIEPKNEDCLLCGLCVRMCHERMGRGAIGFTGRGSKRQVQPAFDVQSDVCQTCGACYFVCPTKGIKFEEITKNEPMPIFSEFDQGLRDRPAIHIPFPQAVPNLAIIDKDRCVHLRTGECKICQEFCDADAIDFNQKEKVIDLNVGSVILSPGFDEYDAKKKSEYGYARYKNVITSIEFERILSASGPFQGHVLRPGDKKEPKRIAFIQCVGSRDPQAGQGYCSSVCCTYAIKEAIIAKEHAKHGLNTTIFFMDIRTFGKGFESYYERAKNEYGVRFIRAGISKIDEDSETRDLIVHYESEAGEIKQEEFDMVILSVGLVPKDGTAQLTKRLRVNLNEYGFCRTSEFMPVDTIRDGIYVCGAFAGPKDIPETVTQASGAAAKAMGLLASARNTLITKKEYPPELDVSNQEPRIGVFICHCGINIGGYVDVPHVVEYTKTLPDVIYAEDNLYTCSQDTQKRIVEMIKEHKLNRVVVASCTPRTHEALFRETIREAGLNPYLFEMANIRDQCSWIHMNEPEEATEKAKDLVRMAVAKTRLLMPLKRVEIDVVQKALVIGGGIAGMVASLSLAEQGFEVFLAEKEKELGGNLNHIYYTIEGRDVQRFLRRTIGKIKNNRLIKVFTDTNIESISGYIGNYETEIIGAKEKLKHGVVIVATGAQEYKPTEYLYGKDKRVITQRELEELFEEVRGKKQEVRSKNQEIRSKNGEENLASPASLREAGRACIRHLNSVVMIQCIGSRDDDHPYCSRMCCSQAVKNSLRLLEINPEVNIYVLYRDVRTYGFKEDFYRKAREAGVIFIRYDDDSKPELHNNNGRLNISVFEPILREKIELCSDLLVLSTGIEPTKDNEILAKMLKVPLNDEGFFLEAHVKLRPVDFATEGVFVAGMAHSPKCIDETISQAEAAAARATTIIANKKYSSEAAVSHVNEELCGGCGICSGLCPFEAIEIVVEDTRRKSKVNEALCKGCGTCVAACPSGAMEQYGFTKHQIMEMIETLVE
ncbi:MAG: FAD-dependent oxidoreductase [bacterium]